MSIANARTVLAQRGWLAQTPPAFRGAVLSRCIFRKFAAGETIYAQGDGPGGLWGLASGTVGIERNRQHHGPSFVHFAGPGLWVGTAPLVLGSERQIGLVATRQSELLNLPITAFHEISQLMPDAWRWIAALSIIQIGVAFGVLEDVLIRDPKRRTAAILLRLAGCRAPQPHAVPDDIFVTQEHLAQMLNMSRTALGEVLRGFAAQGLIKRKYGKISVDSARLHAALADAAVVAG